MATYQKRGTRWRAIVRKAGHPAQSKSFTTKAKAMKWASEIEGGIEDGTAAGAGKLKVYTLGELLDVHLAHLERISDRGRKNGICDRNLRRGLGEDTPLAELDYAKLAQFCTTRITVDGVKPVTAKLDMVHLSGALTTGTIESGIPVGLKQNFSTWFAGLRRAGLVGNPENRDRRPSDAELELLLVHTRHNRALRRIRYCDLIEFAVESSMRLDEICNLRWDDLDEATGTIIIRLRKHPTDKTDQRVPLMGRCLAIIQRQAQTEARIFPYGSESVSNGFRRICRHLGIEGLHFHDLRHEGISRLFERGYQIQEVALVSGHKDWRSLQRYVNLRPDQLAAKDRKQRD